MRAKKLKIYVKTNEFSFPIPALRFGMIKWIFKIIIKYGHYTTREIGSSESKNEIIENILKNMTYKDIDPIIEHLKQLEPFELINVETYDEKEEKVVVKIYTI